MEGVHAPTPSSSTYTPFALLLVLKPGTGGTGQAYPFEKGTLGKE